MLSMEVRHASVEIDGAKLRELRKNAGLTVSELAQRIGLSIPYVSAIERGHRPTVPPATFNRILEALGIEDRNDLIRADAQRVA